MPTAVRLIEGKGAYVRRQLPDGTIQNICECIWNADFSFRGCMAQVHGAYMEEVVRNNGKYDEGTIPKKRKEHGINHVCDYCYVYGNWGQVTPKVVNELTRQDFEAYRPEFVRLGKNTECGHDMYIPVLMDFLDLCKEFGSKIIFPTKMLRYRKDVAEKIADNGGVVHRSIGGDVFEFGAVSQGYTNKWRVEQAKLDRSHGVNEDLTIVCDVTQSISANQRVGFYLVEAMNTAKKFGIPFRVLPIRLNSQALTQKVTGRSMKELAVQELAIPGAIPGLEMPMQRLWRRRGNNELAPNYLHPDFQKLYDQGVGFCGEIGDNEYCDKCNLCPSRPVRIVFPLSQKPPVVYTKKLDAQKRKNWKDREKIATAREIERRQLKLKLP